MAKINSNKFDGQNTNQIMSFHDSEIDSDGAGEFYQNRVSNVQSRRKDENHDSGTTFKAGPTSKQLQERLAMLPIPKSVNKKLTPSGISTTSLATLHIKFGKHGPALYQILRLSKWDIFLKYVSSEWSIILQDLRQKLFKHFHLNENYVTR